MRALIAAALLLAGCAAPDTPQAACERQAENDPTVHELVIKGLGGEAFRNNSQDELRFARQQAVVACLRARGVAPPGGVEPHRPQ